MISDGGRLQRKRGELTIAVGELKVATRELIQAQDAGRVSLARRLAAKVEARKENVEIIKETIAELEAEEATCD